MIILVHILQIADVIRRVVFGLLFLLCFSKKYEMFRHRPIRLTSVVPNSNLPG